MDALIHRLRAWDGLPLFVRDWPGRDPALICLPGLVRTGGDFETLIPAVADGRRAVAVDYPGRGASGRASNPSRYAPEACVRDIMDVCSALHVPRAVVVGTSFGGLLGMGLAVARPLLVQALILNDIGPEIADQGTAFVRDFIAMDPALATLDECVALLRQKLPPLSLENDTAWRRMAELTYEKGADGRFHPLWDVRIASLLRGTMPDLWPLWRGVARVPLLLIRGEVSNILLEPTVARMHKDRSDMTVVVLPGIGHAPTLTEPVSVQAIRHFLEDHA